MPIIKINNRNVNISEINKGASESIIMVHGMLTNLSVFYFNIPSKLSEKYHIVLYDLRSHGLSSPEKEGYDLKTMSNDLLELMDTLHISKAHLIGYSFGGLIALYTAVHHPDKVNKIAIIETPSTDTTTSPDSLRKFGDDFFDHYLESYSSETNIKPSSRQIEKIKRLYNFLLKETTMSKDFIKDKDFTSESNLKKITNEVLLLYADKSDCWIDGERFYKYLPNSNLFIGEGDHSIPIQNPEWVGGKLSAFF